MTTAAELQNWLEADVAPGPAVLATVDALLRLYRRLGLLGDGEERPLHLACPRCESCWRGDRMIGHPPKHPDRAGISVPWIGADFPERRIVVAGLNAHDWGGLDAHWRICLDHRLQQSRGRRGKANAEFALGAAVIARMLDRSVDLGSDAVDAPPQDVAPTWDSIAFLEAIKCSPGTAFSEPFPEMFDECPSLLLVEELKILQPTVLLVFGRSRLRDVVRRALGVTWDEAAAPYESPGDFERDTAVLDGRRFEVFFANHPSRGAWKRSAEQILTSVRSRPAGLLD